MKKILALLFSLIVVFALVACGVNNTDTNTNANTNQNTNTNTGNNENNPSTDEGKDPSEGEPAPVVPDYDSTTVEEALKEELKVFDKEDTFGDEGEALDYTTTYEIDLSKDAINSSYTIDKAGTYRVYGTSTDGQIYINAIDQDVVLVFDGVSLTSGNSIAGPAIYAVDCSSVKIILKDGTKNYLSDSAVNDGEGAVLRVRSCNLTIDGTGTLEIDAKAKNAIANTKEVTIDGGTYILNAPSGHGLYGKQGVNINGGKFDINSGKSGIKSGDGDTELDFEYGYINIKAGSIDIDCGTNGFNCVGPVKVENGRIAIDSESGNAIEAVENVEISGGTLILKSYKSTISTDADVTISSKANIKLETTGNGISATNVTLSTSGVVYIKTTLAYETVTETTSATETRYVLIDGMYYLYDANVHGSNAKQYVLRPGKGINADKLTIKNGILGIDTFQDSINADAVEVTGGKLVLFSLKDAIDSKNTNISSDSDIKILGSEKGINSNNIEITGGKLYIIANKDAINTDSTIISGGEVYLFEKIDTGTSGKVTVNGGLLFMLATNKDAQSTQGSAKYISAPVTNNKYAMAGNWINVASGEKDAIMVELPNNYTDKMVIYYSSATMGEELMVSFGTIDSNGMFSVLSTETIQ